MVSWELSCIISEKCKKVCMLSKHWLWTHTVYVVSVSMSVCHQNGSVHYNNPLYTNARRPSMQYCLFFSELLLLTLALTWRILVSRPLEHGVVRLDCVTITSVCPWRMSWSRVRMIAVVTARVTTPENATVIWAGQEHPVTCHASHWQPLWWVLHRWRSSWHAASASWSGGGCVASRSGAE